MQWDPDRDPQGRPLPRRALQLGLRGETLAAFGRRELLAVQDISAFVAEQRERLAEQGANGLCIPRERVYRPAAPALAARLGLSRFGDG